MSSLDQSSSRRTILTSAHPASATLSNTSVRVAAVAVSVFEFVGSLLMGEARQRAGRAVKRRDEKATRMVIRGAIVFKKRL